MSSKRRLRRNACDGKVRYTSFPEARHAMHSVIRHMGNGGWPMEPYHCEFCKGFHFGHVPAAKLKARKFSQEAKRA